MGYTHYWYVNKKVDQSSLNALKKDAKILIEHGFKSGVLGSAHGDVAKKMTELINSSEISFNGIGENSHETFLFFLKKEDMENGDYNLLDSNEEFFSFTKTNLKPYDEYVVMVLSVIKSYLKNDIKISSDGGDEVFNLGYRKALSILGKKKIKEKIKKID